MSNLFSQVLNMSMTSSVVILLVMLARLLLKRAPKIFIVFVFHHQHVEVKDVQVQWVLLHFH